MEENSALSVSTPRHVPITLPSVWNWLSLPSSVARPPTMHLPDDQSSTTRGRNVAPLVCEHHWPELGMHIA